MSIPVGLQKELLGTLSKSGRQGRILLDRSVGDHSVPAAPAITPTILQVELNYLSLSFLVWIIWIKNLDERKRCHYRNDYLVSLYANGC